MGIALSILHGYIHCMPYGKVLLGPTPNPPDAANSSCVPFVCRLSPLQPGYVMTVCPETRAEEAKRQSAVRYIVANIAD